MLVFSDTDRASFEAAPRWLEIIKPQPGTQVVLVSNHWIHSETDSVASTDSRTISLNEAQALSDNLGTAFASVCTKTGDHIQSTLHALVNGVRLGCKPLCRHSRMTLVDICMYCIISKWSQIPDNAASLSLLPEELQARIEPFVT